MARTRRKAKVPEHLPGTEVRLPADLAPLLVPIEEVFEDPANPRRTKNLDALVAKLRRFGYTDPIVVNAKGMIEAGHQRLFACRQLGATHIPRVRGNHEGIEGLAFNIAHNRSNEEVAEWDDDALAPLLAKLHEEDALEGVGWAPSELSAYLAMLDPPDPGPAEPPTDPDNEWVGMPEFQQDDLTPERSLIVHFANEDDLAAFADLVGQKIGPSTKSLWYPQAEIGHYADKCYEDDPAVPVVHTDEGAERLEAD